MAPHHHSAAPGGAAPPARQRILDAAEHLFAERGYDHTSTDDIAAAAAVAPGLLTRHFTTKIELLLAVVGGNETIAEANVYSAPQLGAAPRQAVAEIWRNLSVSLSSAPAMTTITFQELPRHPELRQHALRAADRITGIVARQLARAAGHTGEPLPAHQAAARLLTIAAATVPLTDTPQQPGLDPAALADFITNGITGPPPGDPASPGPPPGE